MKQQRRKTEALGDCASEAIHGKSGKRIEHPREPGTWLKFITLVVAVVPLSPLAADPWEGNIH
ncbi:MAG: hypothetical protein NT047_16195 [Deltaproteobacteria bacterium]|nr:hypothetical protein [Deltaproteobacteria bacterium]